MVSLITGGAGFIGSHLAEALLARGEQVIILDDLSTGSVENIRHFRTNPSLHCFFESVRDRQLLAELVDESDVVFHLAAAVGVRRIIESPVRTIETNVRGTDMVLEAAAKKKKLVFIASTSEVYGKNGKAAFREDDDTVSGPTTKSRWSYATSKALDEFLALAYWKERRLPVVIGRLFNTVGPRQTGRYGMVLPTFVSQALEGVPLTVYGTRQTESLLWIRRRRRRGHPAARGRRWRGGRSGEHRERRGNHHRGPGPSRQAENQQLLAGPVHSLRRGL